MPSPEQRKSLRKKGLSVSWVCQLFGISHQAHYKRLHLEIRRTAHNRVAEKLVQEVGLRQPKMGTRKLYFLLKLQFVQAGL